MSMSTANVREALPDGRRLFLTSRQAEAIRAKPDIDAERFDALVAEGRIVILKP